MSEESERNPVVTSAKAGPRRLHLHARRRGPEVPARPREGQDHGPGAATAAAGSTSPRAAPARAAACPPRSEVEVSDKGTVVTFSIVRVPSENIQVELPYVRCPRAARRRRHRLPEPDPGVQARRGAHGHARPGGLEAGIRVGAHLREHQVLPPHRRAGRSLRAVQGARLMRDVAIV